MCQSGPQPPPPHPSSNGQLPPGSSPVAASNNMMMSLGSTTPSPRAPSASSSPGAAGSYGGGLQASSTPNSMHHHTPNASPSPQHQHYSNTPQHHLSRTPPSYSPMSQSADTNGGACFDVVNRLKNRLELYRGHHENALSKEQMFIGQYNQKMKLETNRLVKKQQANANEQNSGSGGKKKGSGLGGTSGGSGGRSKATGGGGNKRSASCLIDNSMTTTGPMCANNSSLATVGSSASPTPNGTKAKVPRMSAKQRKLLKQQQQQQQQIEMMANHQPANTTSDIVLMNGSSPRSNVYKFECVADSPTTTPSISDTLKNLSVPPQPPQHMNNYSGPPNFDLPTTIKQEPGYLGQLDSCTLNDLLSSDNNNTSVGLSADDDDSKNLINQILELDSCLNQQNQTNSQNMNGHSNSLYSESSYSSSSNSIFGTSADDNALSNRFGDEDFIEKILEDLKNGFEPTGNNDNNNYQQQQQYGHQLVNNNNPHPSPVDSSYHGQFNESPSPVMLNGGGQMMSHHMSQHEQSSNTYHSSSSSASFSNPSTPIMMNSTGGASSPMNSNQYGAQMVPNQYQMRMANNQQSSSSLPSFNTLVAKQSPRMPNTPNTQVPVQQQMFAQQQLPQMVANSMTPTPPGCGGSASPINNSHLMKSPIYARPNSTGPPAANNPSTNNLLLQPVMNTGSPDPIRTPPSNPKMMVPSPMMCQRANNTPSPVQSPHMVMGGSGGSAGGVSRPPSGKRIDAEPDPGSQLNGPNASVTLKQMAAQQQQQNMKWSNNNGGNSSNESQFYPQQQQPMMIRPQQQRMMLSQQQPILSSQLQQPQQQMACNPNMLQQQQYSRQRGPMPSYSQQPRPNMNQQFYGQQQPQRMNNNIGIGGHPQEIIRTQNIRAQRMLIQQRMPNNNNNNANTPVPQQQFAMNRPSSFNTNPNNAQQMVVVSNNQMANMNNQQLTRFQQQQQNNNYWNSTPSGMIQQQHQQQQYCNTNNAPVGGNGQYNSNSPVPTMSMGNSNSTPPGTNSYY